VTALPDRCAACGKPLADRQRWCLACGAAAGSVVAPTPRWALPMALAALAVLLALAGIGYALATLLSS
jgi:hypothetical protein